MTARIARDPSPIRSAFVHGSLGFVTLVATLGLGGAAIHLGGSADAASPTLRMALFEHDDAPAPGLNPRLPGSDTDLTVMASNDTTGLLRDDRAQPDLGVEYGAAARVQKASATLTSNASTGIRINGQTVLPGQSLSQVQGGALVQTAAEPTPAVMAAAATAQTKTTFERYSRKFVNTENKPTVSIIVGGLGINHRRTQAAINDLPPEITLSFAPTSANLQT
ncbi:MAG: hypothetical protein L3J02_04270, partial [Henriciella sp.]|nr:hypothetical protein [Henriciella sp.]